MSAAGLDDGAGWAPPPLDDGAGWAPPARMAAPRSAAGW